MVSLRIGSCMSCAIAPERTYAKQICACFSHGMRSFQTRVTGTTFIRLPGRLWELTQIPPKHEFVKH